MLKCVTSAQNNTEWATGIQTILVGFRVAPGNNARKTITQQLKYSRFLVTWYVHRILWYETKFGSWKYSSGSNKYFLIVYLFHVISWKIFEYSQGQIYGMTVKSKLLGWKFNRLEAIMKNITATWLRWNVHDHCLYFYKNGEPTNCPIPSYFERYINLLKGECFTFF